MPLAASLFVWMRLDMPAKKRNPTDATLRNVRATAKQFKAHDAVLRGHSRELTAIVTTLMYLKTRVQKLEAKVK